MRYSYTKPLPNSSGILYIFGSILAIFVTVDIMFTNKKNISFDEFRV